MSQSREADARAPTFVPLLHTALVILLCLVVVLGIALAGVRGLPVSHTVYSVAQVDAGLSRHRAAWAGRTVLVQGRILYIKTVQIDLGRHRTTVRGEELPAQLLHCPPHSTIISTSCRLVEPYGSVDTLPIIAQSGSRPALYFGLWPNDPTVDSAPLWLVEQPAFSDPLLDWLGRLLTALHPAAAPQPLRWGLPAVYRVQIASSRGSCSYYVCAHAMLLGTNER